MIALYRGVSPLSRAIRTFTRSDYSHAAWVTMTGTVIEAWWPGGVREELDPFSAHTRGTEIDFFRLSLTLDKERKVEAFLRENMGGKYDLGGVLRFLTRRRDQNEQAWFCSELIFEACEAAGFRLLNADAQLVAPGHLAWSPFVHRVATQVDYAAWRGGVKRHLLGKGVA